MKDWHLLTLTALNPRQIVQYSRWMRDRASGRFNPVTDLHERYRGLPADVTAGLIHRDMQKPGWDTAPDALLNEVSAELDNVQLLLTACAQQEIDATEYVSEENRAEVYKHLLDLHKVAERKRQSEAAAAFCRSTREGTPCQA